MARLGLKVSDTDGSAEKEGVSDAKMIRKDIVRWWLCSLVGKQKLWFNC